MFSYTTNPGSSTKGMMLPLVSESSNLANSLQMPPKAHLPGDGNICQVDNAKHYSLHVELYHVTMNVE